MDNAVLARASDLWATGKRQEALILLKGEGLRPKEAQEAIQAYQASVVSADDLVAKAAEDVLESVLTWDPLTLSVLQAVKVDPAAIGRTQTDDYHTLLRLAEVIHDNLAAMLKMGVNPTKVMAAYENEVYPLRLDQATGRDSGFRDEEASVKALKAAVPVHSLHADLLTLL